MFTYPAVYWIEPPATLSADPGAKMASPCELSAMVPPFKLRSETLRVIAAISPVTLASGVPCQTVPSGFRVHGRSRKRSARAAAHCVARDRRRTPFRAIARR